MKYLIVKRILDIIFSFLALMLLLPLLILIAVIIRVDSKGPALFKHKRYGKDKKDIYIYKFRTMHIHTPKNIPTFKLKDSGNYITRIGKYLRKSSLDELPQLFNVLKGDMSIIGPRPMVFSDYEVLLYRDKFNANNVLPGLTGLAQVSGRDELTPYEKARIDGYYVDHISFKMDLNVFLRTIPYVLFAKGYKEGPDMSQASIKLQHEISIDDEDVAQETEQRMVK